MPLGSQHQHESRILRVFLLSAVVVAALCIAGGFLGMAIKDRQLIHEEMHNRARRDFANIVLMRHWNAGYGGVFVEKRPGVVSNPYLESPDITTTDGRIFTKKNPALMTRELSELVSKDQGYAFHITSLRPLNPGNAPDPLERQALLAFEEGVKERLWEEVRNGQAFFRYMAPLKVQPSCLECHAKQDYLVGQIRGGISVSFRVGELQAKLRQNLVIVGLLAALTLTLLVTSFVLLFRHMVRRLIEARQQLELQATTDALTGLLNRGTVLARLEAERERHRRSGQPLSCLILDVDFFKRVNDRFGHLAGDEVLRTLGNQLRGGLRVYDMVGRYGGEEFLAVMPGASLDTAMAAAERLREAVVGTVQTPDGGPVTVSVGVAAWRAGEPVDDLLARADHALYQAKAAGRNRVVAEA